MANITEEHLHHMARRHHATMKKLDGMREKFAGYAQRGMATAETGAAAWLGGAIEGRTGGKSFGPVPINLGAGVLLLALGHWRHGVERTVKTEVSGGEANTKVKYNVLGDHLTNIGNGLVGSYLAATGYAFGKRWKETGKMLGGGGHPWTQPYENGWPKTSAAPTPPAAPMPPSGPTPPMASGWYDIHE